MGTGRGRPFVFPDPNDRSANEPALIVKSETLLGLYNQYTGEDMKNVTSKVHDWFEGMAKNYNWDSIDFVGNECILKVNLKMRTIPHE